MQIPETIVAGRRYNKFGELFITFKVKKEDRTAEIDKYSEDCWEDGRSLVLVTEEFQSERNSTPVEVKAPEIEGKQEKSIWEKIRDFYVRKKGTEEYEKFKERKYVERYQRFLSGKEVHLSDIFTPEEAEKFFEDIC